LFLLDRIDLSHALQSEIYDPVANEWTLTAPCSVPRLYHSTALLLPEARVVTAGGNPEGGTHVKWGQDPEEEMRLEIFSPPYLLRGARPIIAQAPAELKYGQTVVIGTPDAAAIQLVSLVRNGVTTHSSDTNQRLVDAPITARHPSQLSIHRHRRTKRRTAGPLHALPRERRRSAPLASWVHLS
jgi:hypothetical protein